MSFWSSFVDFLDRLAKFVQGSVVDAVQITGTQSDEGYTGRQRLENNRHDNGDFAFSVSNQVQRLSSRVLRSIASDRPLTRNAGMHTFWIVQGARATAPSSGWPIHLHTPSRI